MNSPKLDPGPTPSNPRLLREIVAPLDDDRKTALAARVKAHMRAPRRRQPLATFALLDHDERAAVCERHGWDESAATEALALFDAIQDALDGGLPADVINKAHVALEEAAGSGLVELRRSKAAGLVRRLFFAIDPDNSSLAERLASKLLSGLSDVDPRFAALAVADVLEAARHAPGRHWKTYGACAHLSRKCGAFGDDQGGAAQRFRTADGKLRRRQRRR